MQLAEQELNLADVVENEIKSNTPILMCAAPGFDASGRVDDLAAELNRQITSIAIGKHSDSLIQKVTKFESTKQIICISSSCCMIAYVLQ